MEDVNEQVVRIDQKLQQLLKQYQFVQKENQQLQKENTGLKERLQKVHDDKNRLQQQTDVYKINSTPMEETSRKELEKRINTYIKDIDKCLALLHS